MAGIGHRGFMGRRRGDNFRYLFEEVPGVVTGWSQIKLRREYNGDCVQIASNDYGFTNNIVNLNDILSDLPSGGSLGTMYDHVSTNDLVYGGSGHEFDSSIENFDLITQSTSVRVFSPANLNNITSSTPATVYFILQKTSGASGVLFGMNESLTLRFDLQFQSSGNLLLRMNNILVNFGTSFNTNTDNNLWCVTYDGSESSAGLRLYRNDMSTEVAFTTRTSPATTISSATFNSVYSLGVSTAGNNCVLGLHRGMVVCEAEHNQTQRETTKEIFEQLFTFG